jgi:hypothetical protein
MALMSWFWTAWQMWAVCCSRRRTSSRWACLCIPTGVTIMADDEVRAILGLPDNVYHATTIPTAYYTGTTFHRAERIPLDDVVHFDRW